MAKKKSSSAKPSTSEKSTGFQLQSVVLFVVALLMLAFVLLPLDGGWKAVHNFFMGLFGWTAYAAPVLLGYIAILLAKGSTKGKILGGSLKSVAFILLAGGIADVFLNDKMDSFGEHISEAYTAGFAGGGFFSSLISYPVLKFATKTGAAIIYILLLFLLIMFVTKTPLMTFIGAVSKPVKKIGDGVKEGYEEIKERRMMEKEREADYDIALTDADELARRGEKPAAKKPETLSEKGRRVLSAYYDKEIPEEEEKAEDGFILPPEDEDEKEYSIDDIIRKRTGKAPASSASAAADKPLIEKQSAEKPSDEESQTEEKEKPQVKAEPKKQYRFPPLALLERSGIGSGSGSPDELKANAEKLVETLQSFGVGARIIDISRGPAVTRYELQPSAGVKISKITNLADDIALNLAAAGVRIEAPIPNKAAIGIEIPNKSTAVVGIRDIIESKAFTDAKSRLTFALGKDIAGECKVADIGKMPHMLIAGATGSGKSVCINSLIISLLYKSSPDDVRFLMIDPKMVELGGYNGIPHLLVPVVTDPRKAAGALSWAVSEMIKRYKIFGDNGVKDLESYNRLAEKSEELIRLPQVVIIIDELADLMMAAPNEVEDSICRLAQMARAAGMHLVIATQRPSVDVITGLIKANIPSRISFAVANQFDSRTILDQVGAEKLLGRGDMLFAPVGANKPTRIQGCFVSDREAESVISFVKANWEADYDEDVAEQIEKEMPAEKGNKGSSSAASDGDVPSGDGDLIDAATEVAVEAGIISVSLLQRKLKLGYARAARIVDELEERGIVGPFEGSKPRKVLLTKQQWLEMKNRE